MSVTKHEENPIEANMDVFQSEISQIQNLINLKIYTDPLRIEETIKELKLKYESGILWILRSWWFDEEIMNEQQTIIMSN